MALNESLCDYYRITYLRQLLGNLTDAVEEDGEDLQVSACAHARAVYGIGRRLL